MCAYKLVTGKFQVFGIQSRTETLIEDTERDLFLEFHKQVFALIDEWHDLTIADIREIEEQVKKELDLVLYDFDYC